VRYLILFGIFAIILFGCLGQTSPESSNQESNEPEGQECHFVTTQVPVTEEKCEDVSFTEPICETRALNYTITPLSQTDICISGESCVGQSVYTCFSNCRKVMTRCVLIITNDDKIHSGSWTVGANYTIGNYGFIKDPIIQVIKPGESSTFDFHQIYTLGVPPTTAQCNVYLVTPAVIEDCYEVTRTTQECVDVTTYVDEQTEVCE